MAQESAFFERKACVADPAASTAFYSAPTEVIDANRLVVLLQVFSTVRPWLERKLTFCRGA